MARWRADAGGDRRRRRLDDNLRLQDRAAQKLKDLRQQHGALDFETIQARADVCRRLDLTDLEAEKPNRAKELIDDFMVAANGVTARFLAAKKSPSLRRVVRTPKHWDRIVELAAEHGTALPPAPDAVALKHFPHQTEAADPLRFPDLSLARHQAARARRICGRAAGRASNRRGISGLAVEDYAHSTAPNRRYPDVITQRLLKAALAGRPSPYGNDELVHWPSIAPTRKTPRRRSSGR